MAFKINSILILSLTKRILALHVDHKVLNEVAA